MYKTIESKVLRDILLGGCKNLEANREQANSLNVFPVPDGDTGTNMSMTIRSAVKELEKLQAEDLSIATISELVISGSLKGARGNSGVILSQILKGLCVSIQDKKEITPKDFVQALKSAAKVAYCAVSKPKEGTILTVIRVIAEECPQCASHGAEFDKFFEGVIQIGEDILARTPEMLPVLKKAGVVDAGGFGLICIMKGWLKALKGEAIETETVAEQAEDEFEPEFDSLEDIKFAYCTEFFITNLFPKTTMADIDKLRSKLLELGDSLICIGDLNLVKVHVHTNTPGIALQYALELGELDKVKIENMLIQHREILAKRESEKKPLGIITVCSGEGYSSIFKEIGVDYIIEGGQSMNPSVDDFLLAIKKVNADNILIFPNNKNVILAANQARELVGKHCVVVPTVNVAGGVATVVNINREVSAEDNAKNALKVLDEVVCGTVTTAVRSVSIDGIKVKAGNIIGLSDKKILSKGVKVEDVVLDLVHRLGGEDKDVLTIYYGKDVEEENALELAELIEEKFDELEVMVYPGGQPHYFYDLILE